MFTDIFCEVLAAFWLGFLQQHLERGRMNIALLLSGGTGARMGTKIPKQYLKAGGRPVFSYCMQRLLEHEMIDRMQIVATPTWQEEISIWAERLIGKKIWERKFGGFSVPGENRQMSVYHGLEDIMKYGSKQDRVIVHDAARPMITQAQISFCLAACEGHDGAIPVLPMKDTVYYSRDGRRVERLLQRSAVYAGQAPEVFVLGKYYQANRRLLPEAILKINGSTEPAVLAGMDIVMIPGDEENFKITTRTDLDRFCTMAGKQESLGTCSEGGVV